MSFVLMLIATILWIIAALLVVAEDQLLGWDALGWAILGLPFFGLSHLTGGALPAWITRSA